jgi:hypothetical protein
VSAGHSSYVATSDGAKSTSPHARTHTHIAGGVYASGPILTDPVVQSQDGRCGPTDLGHEVSRCSGVEPSLLVPLLAHAWIGMCDAGDLLLLCQAQVQQVCVCAGVPVWLWDKEMWGVPDRVCVRSTNFTRTRTHIFVLTPTEIFRVCLCAPVCAAIVVTSGPGLAIARLTSRPTSPQA